jgi:hypothetical protein
LSEFVTILATINDKTRHEPLQDPAGERSYWALQKHPPVFLSRVDTENPPPIWYRGHLKIKEGYIAGIRKSAIVVDLTLNDVDGWQRLAGWLDSRKCWCGLILCTSGL